MNPPSKETLFAKMLDHDLVRNRDVEMCGGISLASFGIEKEVLAL